jgi:hypothetical protein
LARSLELKSIKRAADSSALTIMRAEQQGFASAFQIDPVDLSRKS